MGILLLQEETLTKV